MLIGKRFYFFLLVFVASLSLTAKVGVKACTSNAECNVNEWCDLSSDTCTPYAVMEPTSYATTGPTSQPTTEETATATPIPSPTPLPITNVCTQGVDLIIQKDGAVPESAAAIGGTVSYINGCPFISSPFLPQDTVRVTEVFDGSSYCPPCSGNVKDLIIKYFKGDLASGNQLCNLPFEELQNCVILNSSHSFFIKSDEYLAPEERDKLKNKYKLWNDRDGKSDNVTVFAGARQTEEANGLLPQDVSVTITESTGRSKEIKINVAKDIMKKEIDPSQAIRDLQGGNIEPDYDDSEGRRQSGSLDYVYWIKDDTGKEIPGSKHKPYYHGNFFSFFTLGFFSKIGDPTLNNDGSISTAFANLLNDWDIIRKKVGLAGRGLTQKPIKSPWWPKQDAITDDSGKVERFATFIYAKSNNDTDEFQFVAGNDIKIAREIFYRYYRVGNQNSYRIPAGTSLGNAIADIKDKAGKAKKDGKRVQLFIYVTGHGNRWQIEEGIDDISEYLLKDKNGAYNQGVGQSASGTSPFLTERDLKKVIEDLVEKAKVVDDVYFINDSCYSGASVI